MIGFRGPSYLGVPFLRLGSEQRLVALEGTGSARHNTGSHDATILARKLWRRVRHRASAPRYSVDRPPYGPPLRRGDGEFPPLCLSMGEGEGGRPASDGE